MRQNLERELPVSSSTDTHLAVKLETYENQSESRHLTALDH